MTPGSGSQQAALPPAQQILSSLYLNRSAGEVMPPVVIGEPYAAVSAA